MPPGVNDLESLKLAPDLLEERMEQAGLSLLTRGVLPGPSIEGIEEDSRTLARLDTVCNPTARYIVATGRLEALQVRDFAVSASMAVGHVWNSMGLHLAYELEEGTIGDAVMSAARLPSTEDKSPACELVLPVDPLQAALAGGPDKLHALLADALKMVGRDPSWAHPLADYLLNGGPVGLAMFHAERGERGRAFELYWLDAGPAGLWTTTGPNVDSGTTGGKVTFIRLSGESLFSRLQAGYAAVAEFAEGAEPNNNVVAGA
jgi:hypothetical protein